MNIELLAQHVQHLAVRHNIEIIHVPGMTIDQACAQRVQASSLGLAVQLSFVYTPPVIDETSYSTAMHELGHLIAPNACEPNIEAQMAQSMVHKLEQEDRAWAWARENALVWTAEMETDARYARETYRKNLEMAVKMQYIRHAPAARNIKEWK